MAGRERSSQGNAALSLSYGYGCDGGAGSALQLQGLNDEGFAGFQSHLLTLKRLLKVTSGNLLPGPGIWTP